jgi:small conductance mechanosensitive channel
MNLGEAVQKMMAKLSSWLEQLILMLPNLVVATFVVFASWLLARLVRSLILQLLRRASSVEEINGLLASLLSFATMTAGVFIALGIVGLDKTVTSMLAGAGIVALAIGLAFQNIASNFIAGIFLSTRRPFQTNHVIETNNFSGTVQRMSLRSTELRTPQGQIVLIPNKEVFEKPIVNYTVSKERRVDLKVDVAYTEDLERVKTIISQALEAISFRQARRDVELFYEEFADSSIKLAIRFWIDFARQTDFLQARSAAIEKIKQAFDAHNIIFPSRTLTLDIATSEKLFKISADHGDSQGNKNNLPSKE